MNTAVVIIIVLILAYFVHKALCKCGSLPAAAAEGLVIIKKPLLAAAGKLNSAAALAEGYTNPVGVLSRSPAFVVPGTLARVSV